MARMRAGHGFASREFRSWTACVALCALAGGLGAAAQSSSATNTHAESESNVITVAFVEEVDPTTTHKPTFEHDSNGWYIAEDFLDCRALAADVEKARANRDAMRITLEPRDALRFQRWIERSADRRVGVFFDGRLRSVLPVSSCSGDALLIWARDATDDIASADAVEFKGAYAPQAGAESWIELKRTGGPDGCPAYTLRLQPDGAVDYVGTSGVAQVGERSARVSPLVARRVFLRFQAADFFSLPEASESGHSTILALHVNGRSRRVNGSEHAEREVTSTGRLVDLLAQAVDTEVRSRRWSGRERFTPCPAQPLSSDYTPKVAHAFEIRLVRGECFGRCPIYEVVIRGNGSVEYVGAKHVVVTGGATTSISPEFAKALIDRFQEINFWKLRDRYDTQASDIPAIAISLSMDGRTKKVVNRWPGFREELRQLPDLQSHLALDALARAIDIAADSEQWVRPPESQSPK